MLEILKKLASVGLDVQHIQRISNILYSNPNVAAENVSKLCADMSIAIDNVINEANAIKELIAGAIALKKD